MYVLHVCITCMYYMYILHVFTTCMYCMYVLHLLHVCMHITCKSKVACKFLKIWLFKLWDLATKTRLVASLSTQHLKFSEVPCASSYDHFIARKEFRSQCHIIHFVIRLSLKGLPEPSSSFHPTLGVGQQYKNITNGTQKQKCVRASVKHICSGNPSNIYA